MENKTRKDHWEKIYVTKRPEEVSWTQENPKTSLDFIRGFNLPPQASIIDIGGGDSKLVDNLINEGFKDITVLDISEHALNRAKERLGDKAENVSWVVSDITEFNSEKTFDVWHDRATFHFLTTTDQINKYLVRAKDNLKGNGFLIIGTFSDQGPDKCSGLEIKKYSEESLQGELKGEFEKIKCIKEDHKTPFNTLQNFLFCSFKRCTICHDLY